MKSFKKIAVSALTVAALSCSAFGAFAADANTIKSCKISVLQGESVTEVTDENSITIAPNDILKFEVELANKGFVTLLSTKDGATAYDNGTIQYIAQSESTATIQFRPRTTLGPGEYAVKIGGTDVADAKTVKYKVAEPLTVKDVNVDIYEYDSSVPEDYAEFEISGVSSGSGIKINIGETELLDRDYTLTADSTNSKWTLKIGSSKFKKGVGDSATVTISAGGATKTSTVNVWNTVKYTNVDSQTLYRPAKDGKTTLKPVTATKSTKGTKVVSNTGYFKDWAPKTGSTTALTVEANGAEVDYDMFARELDFEAYTAQNGATTTDVISKAGAQKIVYKKNNNGSEVNQDAIRFVALVKNSENIEKAGFVISDIQTNPTVEAGFAKSNVTSAFENIRVRTDANATEATYKSVSELKGDISGINAEVDAIIFAVLDVNNQQQKGAEVFATPYIQYNDGSRVYGETKAVKYSDLQ